MKKHKCTVCKNIFDNSKKKCPHCNSYKIIGLVQSDNTEGFGRAIKNHKCKECSTELTWKEKECSECKCKDIVPYDYIDA